MPHTSNFLFIIFYYSMKSLPFHHILVPLVEEDSASFIYDDSNGSGSDSEFEYLRCPSCRKSHHKLPDIKSIWGFFGIYTNV